MNIINIVPTREIQRDYRQLINRLKRTKKPVFLGSRGKLEAVLLNAQDYLASQTKTKLRLDPSVLVQTMRKLRQEGRKNVSLIKALRHDRDSR